MSDQLTILKAMFDSGLHAYIGKERDDGRVSWALVWDHLTPLDESGGRHGTAPTLAMAIYDLADAACEEYPDSDFAKFYEGGAPYFFCIHCYHTFFGVKPKNYGHLGGICPDCAKTLPREFLTVSIRAEIYRIKELLPRAELALESNDFEIQAEIYDEIMQVEK